MKLDLSEIARNVGMRYHYVIDEPTIEDDTIVSAGAIEGVIDFANTGRAIVAVGEFHAAVQLECSRCLEVFAAPITAHIEELLPIATLLEGEPVEEEDLGLQGEDEIQNIFANNMLDLTELIRQSLIIDTPIRPLCEEACKGLCPICGRNLNEGRCECKPEAESSPFGKLAEILENGERGAEEQDEQNN